MSNDFETPDNHEAIAALAQKFWEEEGRPDGKADEHWLRAKRQLREREQMDSTKVVHPISAVSPKRPGKIVSGRIDRA